MKRIQTTATNYKTNIQGFVYCFVMSTPLKGDFNANLSENNSPWYPVHIEVVKMRVSFNSFAINFKEKDAEIQLVILSSVLYEMKLNMKMMTMWLQTN